MKAHCECAGGKVIQQYYDGKSVQRDRQRVDAVKNGDAMEVSKEDPLLGATGLTFRYNWGSILPAGNEWSLWSWSRCTNHMEERC